MNLIFEFIDDERSVKLGKNSTYFVNYKRQIDLNF